MAAERRETPEEIAARVRGRLPDFLKDPATVKANDERQAALRASYSRARLNEGEMLIARGAQIEEATRATIAQMGAHREDGHNVSTRGGANKPMLDEQYTALAIGLEMQGRYVEASAVHPMKREQNRLLEIHEAVERDDELCDCPRKSHELNGAKMEISPRRSLKTIYSRKHGGAVALMKCDSCGHLNARPLTGQAAQIQASRVEGRAAAEAGRQARTDVQVLRAK